MKLGPCSDYNNCDGEHYFVNPYVAFWDCRCGLMRYWILRRLFARDWYGKINRAKKTL